MAARHVAGRLNGIHADPGTLLGPRGLTRELLVVLDADERGVTVGYATTDEIEAALARDARSVTEHHLQRTVRRRRS